MRNVKTYSGRVRWKHLAKVFTETSHTVTVSSAVRHHGKITMFHIAAFIDTFLHVLNLAKLFKVIRLERHLGLLFLWRSRRCTFVFGNRVAVSYENYCRRNDMRSNAWCQWQKDNKDLTEKSTYLPCTKARSVNVNLNKVISFLF